MEKIGVVFVSRRDSLRSILAAACLRHLDPVRFLVYSCGQPGQLARSIHPAAVGALYSASIPVPTLGTRSWDIFQRTGAPRMKLVITLDAGVALLEPPCG